MSNRKIMLIADSAVLNTTVIKPFQNLTPQYSVYLHSLLLSNWIEILNELKENSNLMILLSEQDKEYIPKKFIPEDFKEIFYSGSSIKKSEEELLKQKLSVNAKTLFLYHNSMGIKQDDFERIFNLTQSEDNSIVLLKSKSNLIIGNCIYEPETILINSLFTSNRNYKNYLNSIGSHDVFIHTLEGFLSIDDFEDIKKLYIELSKKESLSYCSQKMHESFNDLFVEYKEKLNE